MPGFLLHHIIFNHGLVDGLGPDLPRLQGNLLCYEKIALSGRVILLVQEVAANPWCTEREHLRSGTCSEERRATWAHVGLSQWHRCASKIGGFLYRTSGQLQRLRTRTLGVGPRQGWELLPECARISALAAAHRTVPASASSARASVSVIPHRMRFLTWASISLHAVWDLCAPAAFWLRNQQQRSFNVAAGQAVGNRCSRTEAPREEFACASRPLGTHHGRKRKNPGSYCGTARPRRGGPHAGRSRGPQGISSRRHSQSSGAQKQDRRRHRHRRSGEHRAVASGPKNKHFSTSHHLLTIISPCHPTHPTTLIFDLLTVQFHSNPSASCQLGHRPRTIGAEMSREDDEHWEWVCTSAQSEAPADARRSEGAPEQGNSAHVGNPSRGTPQQERVGAVRSIIRRAVQCSSEERRSGQRAHPPSSPPRRQHSRRGQATHDQPRMRRAARQRSQQA